MVVPQQGSQLGPRSENDKITLLRSYCESFCSAKCWVHKKKDMEGRSPPPVGRLWPRMTPDNVAAACRDDSSDASLTISMSEALVCREVSRSRDKDATSLSPSTGAQLGPSPRAE